MKLSTRSIKTAEAIGNQENFTTYGALSAHSNRVGPWDSGRLSGFDLDCFRNDAPDIVYTVFSYATPIAWITHSGKRHRVAQKFSVTTSRHQGMLYLLGS